MSNKATPSSGEPFVPRPTTTLQTFLPEFWSHVIRRAEQYQSDFKDGQLPLARIKKLVKSDPDIKMIANEVTILLDKACETNSLNRRTVNVSDVSLAISQSDMFDFLIDIVPTEQHVAPEDNSNAPSNSATPALPTTAATTSKHRRQTNSKAPDNQQRPTECSSSQLAEPATSLPPAKKKVKKNKVNRNLLPEEVAVPIPDEELIPPETSHQLPGSGGRALNFNRRVLAVPIPDSKLVPPQSSGPSWELAVPIASSSQFSSSMNPPPVPSRSWELAVPIADSTPTSPAWEMAVPIPDEPSSHRPSNPPSNKRKRMWALAVPIVDETDQNSPSGSTQCGEEFHHHHSLTSSSAALNHHPPHFDSTNSNQTRTWELAVPITDKEPMAGSTFSRITQDLGHRTQPNSFENTPDQEVPIDPALFNLSSSMKVDPE